MPNNQLPQNRSAIEVARHQYEQLFYKYVNLFEFSPIGFLVLDEDGLIQELNRVAAALFSTPRRKLIGRRITDFIHRDDQDLFYLKKFSCQRERKTRAFELKMKIAKDQFVDIRLQLSPIHDQLQGAITFSVALTDISGLMHLSASAHLQHQSLELTNIAENRVSLIGDHVRLIKTSLGCDAVGIRIDDSNGGIPYLVQDGFHTEWLAYDCPVFLTADTGLCRMVNENTAEAGPPFFTPKGTLYINGISNFRSTMRTGGDDLPKSVCPIDQYESMAMIRVVVSDSINGLIHLADHRENQFPLRVVETLELVAFRLGQAIHRFNLQEDLLRSKKNMVARYFVWVAS